MAKERVTYYLRCQPYIDSPEGILVNYLLHHPVYDSKRVAFDAFEAFWKALAYQAQGASSEEEVRILGWDCINSLLNQVDYIRARLELDGSQLGSLLVSRGCAHLPGYLPSFVPSTGFTTASESVLSKPSRQSSPAPQAISSSLELEQVTDSEADPSEGDTVNLAGFDPAMLGPTFS
ncbi:hypothetical protein QUB17_21345 [Microcoleus sp. B5-C4]|uniref:hypothetical protein n=1 Tax=Microcoleus sp. B5-C4 TaxID=2818675 RepID=UPI002FD163BF